MDINLALSQKFSLVSSILEVRCFTVVYVGTNPPILCSNKLLFLIYSISSGDSDLIGVEENPEFSPYDRSGIANDGFTPESAEARRVSVNPMFAAGLSQLSASALLEKPTASISANPLAEMQYKDGNYSDSDGGDYGEIAKDPNRNFTFYGKMDSIPTTQL